MAFRSRSSLPLILASCASLGRAFQTTQMPLPVRVDPIPRHEIRDRLGLKGEDDGDGSGDGESSSSLVIGSGPNMAYRLVDEHEVLCPLSGAHQGTLCAALLSRPLEDRDRADSLANHHELVSQAIMSATLAASVRSRPPDGNGMYYLPVVVTLVESLMPDEARSIVPGERVFNSGGLETNEILMDVGSDWDSSGEEDGRRRVMMYACNTAADRNSATSDVYVLPAEKRGKVWRFSVDFKVTTINLREIRSFGDRDSTTPLRPDVWLKDDSY